MSKIKQPQTDITADTLPIDASGFTDGNLDPSVDTVQKLADAVDALTVSAGAPGDTLKVEHRQISAGEFAAGFLLLSDEPTDPTDITVLLVGGSAQYLGVDFVLEFEDLTSDYKKLRWQGLPLGGLISTGARLVIVYSVGAIQPNAMASNVKANVAGFDGKLSNADDNVQKALNTLDDHNHEASEIDVDALPELLDGANTVQEALALLDVHTHLAEQVELDTGAFSKNLSGSDTTVQEAMETLDQLTVPVNSHYNILKRTGYANIPNSYAPISLVGGGFHGALSVSLDLEDDTRNIYLELNTIIQVTFSGGATVNTVYLRVSVNGTPDEETEQLFPFIKDTQTNQHSFPLHFSAILPNQSANNIYEIEMYGNDTTKLKIGVIQGGSEQQIAAANAITTQLKVFAV